MCVCVCVCVINLFHTTKFLTHFFAEKMKEIIENKTYFIPWNEAFPFTNSNSCLKRRKMIKFLLFVVI